MKYLAPLLLVMGSLHAPTLDAVMFAPKDMPAHAAALALAAEPDYASAKRATVRIESPTGICSGTAIGHHKVLTAAHCVEKGLAWAWIGGRSAVVTSVELDAHDGAILTTDLYFKHVAPFGPRPAQGDVVFSHGNPATTPDILLLGRVAGWAHYQGIADVMLLDRNDWYGCSGAAVFDARGRIVGIVNAIFPWPNQGWRLTAVYPLTFTPEQLA